MASPIYNADIYDATVPESFFGDLVWYRRKARESGGPVLELGAGTGRIALKMAEDGVAVHALDCDRDMLSAPQRKAAASPQVRDRIEVVEGDMRTFELRERFALIIAPFRTLLHNLTEEDHLATFRRVRAHLRPHGRFAFNVFHPSLEFMSQHAGPLAGVWRWASTSENGDGTTLVRSDANRYDTVHRRIHSLIRYEEFTTDGTLARTFVHRLELSYLYPSDIRRLLSEAGFRSVEIYGGFDERPFARDSDELVVVAACE
ncbi:MAG TPA: class I SAM-dependent methyltransferase [Vicinamibacterales bacterium]|nr:class I SAM-dependent methyltransferase [Vicinamibacterales bacterium]